MNKSEFISAVAERAGRPKTTVAEVIDEAVSVITDELAKGETISFVGFGTISTAEVGEKTIHGFGKETVVPAHKKITFKAGKPLKDAVNK